MLTQITLAVQKVQRRRRNQIDVLVLQERAETKILKE